MKILFVQNCIDAIGGAEKVNFVLTNLFAKGGHEITVVYRWDTKKNEVNPDDLKATKIRISEAILSPRPYGRQILKSLLTFRWVTAIKQIADLIYYPITLLKEERKGKKIISSLDFDVAIVSNTRLIKCIPKKRLPHTIVHMHSGVRYYHNAKRDTKLLLSHNRYGTTILWLTESSAVEGDRLGFLKNRYINNPPTFESTEVSSLTNQDMVYIGRYSSEKRINELVMLFDQFTKQTNSPWKLHLYGSGDIYPTTKQIIDQNPQIILEGVTHDVRQVLLNSSLLLLTSSYEGYPMVVREAYECGVPVIAYYFGNTAVEVIKHNETGYIINELDQTSYIDHLIRFTESIDERKRLARGAKAYANSHTLFDIEKEWMKLLEEVIHEIN